MDIVKTRDDIRQAHVDYTLENKIALAVKKFFTEVNYANTHIGDIHKSMSRGEDDYIVCGHIEQVGSAGSQIMTSVKTTTMSVKNKFKNINGMTIVQLMSKYTDLLSSGEANQAIQNINDVNRNKKFIVPFKVGGYFRVKSDEGKEYKCYLEQIRWKLSQETFKIVPALHFESRDICNRSFLKDLTTYGEQFRMETLTQWLPQETKGLLKMNNDGVIRTVAFSNGMQIVAIDNQWIYLQDISGRLEVVGEWTQQGMEIYNPEKIPPNIFSKIRPLEELIKSHRKYISPLFMTDINIMEV